MKQQYRDLDAMEAAGAFDRSIHIFGYGSLMWRPGFPFVSKQRGRLFGYHRRFCVYSHVYRGTRDAPGLVLGLDRGGSCQGMLFEVAAEDARETTAYLDEREMIYSVYRPVTVRVQGENGPVMAHTYVVKRGDHQYADGLAQADLARLLATRHGQSGSNLDYLRNTVEHLGVFDIHDRNLEQLLTAAEAVAD